MTLTLSKYQAGLFRVCLGLSLALGALGTIDRPLAAAVVLLGLLLALGPARRLVAVLLLAALLVAQWATPELCPVPHLFLLVLVGLPPAGVCLARESRHGVTYALPGWLAGLSVALLVALYGWTAVGLLVLMPADGDVCYWAPAFAGAAGLGPQTALAGWSLAGATLLALASVAGLRPAGPFLWTAGTLLQTALTLLGRVRGSTSETSAALALLALHALTFDRRWLPGRVPDIAGDGTGRSPTARR